MTLNEFLKLVPPFATIEISNVNEHSHDGEIVYRGSRENFKSTNEYGDFVVHSVCPLSRESTKRAKHLTVTTYEEYLSLYIDRM